MTNQVVFGIRKPKGRDTLKVDAHRYVKEDMERSKRLTDASNTMVSQLKNANERSIKTIQPQNGS